jgi:hypothetical protein
MEFPSIFTKRPDNIAFSVKLHFYSFLKLMLDQPFELQELLVKHNRCDIALFRADSIHLQEKSITNAAAVDKKFFS